VRYEQAATFDEATEVAEKKEVSMEEVPRLIVQSMVKIIQFSTEPELWKHPEVRSHMESAMEQMINQMNQLSFHLLQPRTSKRGEGLVNNSMLQVSGDGTLFKRMSKLASLGY